MKISVLFLPLNLLREKNRFEVMSYEDRFIHRLHRDISISMIMFSLKYCYTIWHYCLKLYD